MTNMQPNKKEMVKFMWRRRIKSQEFTEPFDGKNYIKVQ